MRILNIAITVLSLIQCLSAYATTIAFDGKILAAESQVTHGERKLLNRNKITECGDYYLAGAGTLMIVDKFVADFKKSGKDEAVSNLASWDRLKELAEDDSTAQIFILNRKTNECSLIQVQGDIVKEIFSIVAPAAFGSGSDFAMGAMIHGANATEAVEVAKKIDLYSGGEVHSVTADLQSTK